MHDFLESQINKDQHRVLVSRIDELKQEVKNLHFTLNLILAILVVSSVTRALVVYAN